MPNSINKKLQKSPLIKQIETAFYRNNFIGLWSAF